MLVSSTNSESLSPSLENKSPGVTVDTVAYDNSDSDAEFGGPEARKSLEKGLLFKLDLRMVSSDPKESGAVQLIILDLVDLNCHLHLKLCRCFLCRDIR